MQLKKSMSCSPTVGFLKAQMHRSLFSCLVFTILMVAIAFLIGDNPRYGSNADDVSLIASESINFARIIMAVGFCFAAYIFRPFMSKIERDTVLSLPIKKTHLIFLQIIIGLLTIFFGTVLVFCGFYPAMNLSEFRTLADYQNAVQAAFSGIFIPLCIYYLVSTILIIRSRNFLSSAALLAAFAVCSFYINVYISKNGGVSAIGADITEITNAAQPFYYNTGILLPTSLIVTLLKLIINVNVSSISPLLLIVIINTVLLITALYVLWISAKSAYLGELNRPFAIIPFVKVLPIALLLSAGAYLINEKPEINLYIVTAASVLLISVAIIILTKNIRSSIIRITACTLIILMPLSASLAEKPMAERITYDIPSLSNVEAVYFNAVNPLSSKEIEGGGFRISNMTIARTETRYRFESEDAITKIIELHKTIIDKIKEHDLINVDSFKVDDNITTASYQKLDFVYDEYKNDVTKPFELALEEDDYWEIVTEENYEYDYSLETESNLEIEANNNLPVYSSSPDEPSVNDAVYNATFYYKLRDGRMFCRRYSPLPVSWVRFGMLKILSCDEYRQNEINYVKNLYKENESSYGYEDIRYAQGAARPNYGSDRIPLDSIDKSMALTLAIMEDESHYTDVEIASQEIVYSIRYDSAKLIQPGFDTFYIRTGYTKTLELLKEYIKNNENNDYNGGEQYENSEDFSNNTEFDAQFFEELQKIENEDFRRELIKRYRENAQGR